MKSFAVALAALVAGAAADGHMAPAAPVAYPAAANPYAAPVAAPVEVPAQNAPAAMPPMEMVATPVVAAPGAAMTHMVIVGGAANGSPLLTYQPEEVQAAVGDVVRFQFMAKNHTITQSTFALPCVRNMEGQNSGFMPNMDNARTDITFDVPVTTADPQWFYCAQRTGNHCGKGMVFAINPTAERTFAMFKAAAIAQNGTVAEAPPAGAPPAAPPAPAAPLPPVDISAGVPAATPGVAPPAGAPAAAPSVVPGQGQNADGSSCSCSCLCGASAFPAGLGANAFGGIGGMMTPVQM